MVQSLLSISTHILLLYSSSATLGVLAFDGASKRNRPNIRIGSLVYARISKTNKDIEPELTCEG
jgi:exosome complex RNA-binding protein Rrp4